MRKFLSLALLAAAPAMANEMVATNGSDTVTLTQAPCHAEVLPLLAVAFPQVADRFRAASATLEGAKHIACWVVRPDGKVLLVYSDGDAGLIPVTEFLPAGAKKQPSKGSI